MATKQIHQYTAAVTIDGAADFLLIDPGSTGTYNKINRNVLLGITSTPIGASDSQTLQNKTLDNTNIITVKDGSFTVQNTSDTTKRAVLSAAGITTGNTRTLTLPNRTDTLVTLAGTESLTNKTITSPTISGGTIDNAAITVDSISGHTVAANVTVGGVALNNGVVSTANSVTAVSIAAGGVQPQALVAGTGTGWAWTTFIPTFTGFTVGNGAQTGKYIQIGKTVFMKYHIIGGTTTIGASDTTFTLPVTAAPVASSNTEMPCLATTYDGSSNVFLGFVTVSTTTAGSLRMMGAGATYVNQVAISSTVPTGWGNAHEMAFMLIYEAA